MLYSNAPIQEAVFDIRVDKLKIQQVEDLLKFKGFVKEKYLTEKKKHAFSSVIQFGGEAGAVASNTQNEFLGYIFSSEDNTRQLQARLDGFTFNVLKPYDSWETHFEEFIKYWEIYYSLFSPLTIGRIAVRYINRIEIPMPLQALQDYIVNVPPVPKSLPQSLANFFMQVQVPCKDGYRIATITETIESKTDESLHFILDIDVAQTLDIGKSTSELIDNFNQIRIIKNEVFESCITEKSRNLFL